MSSVAGIKVETAEILNEMKEAPFAALQFTAITLAETAGLSGLLETVMTRLQDETGPQLAQVMKIGQECVGRWDAVTEGSVDGKDYVERAHIGLVGMAGHAEEARTATVTGQEYLQTALGHLAQLTEAVDNYNAAINHASTHAKDSQSQGALALGAMVSFADQL